MLSNRAGELSSDPSSVTTCETIHKHFHLLNKYLNELFLHITSHGYKNVWDTVLLFPAYSQG